MDTWLAQDLVVRLIIVSESLNPPVQIQRIKLNGENQGEY